MRILTSSGKIYLDYVIHKVAEETESRKNRFTGANAGEVARQGGFNEEGVYDAADYRTVYTLVGNTKQRSVGDLFKRALMASYLLKILVTNNSITKNSSIQTIHGSFLANTK